MMLELYILFQIAVIGFFFVSFFTKQELLWALTLLTSVFLMVSSYDINYYIYQFNATLGAYQPVVTTFSYPYLLAFNIVFFGLSIILMLWDIIEKYGVRFSGGA